LLFSELASQRPKSTYVFVKKKWNLDDCGLDIYVAETDAYVMVLNFSSCNDSVSYMMFSSL